MLSYSEVILLRDQLASGEIGLEAAQVQYWKDFKEGQRSWHTKDWKDRRDIIIKDKCEICSSDDTLTLQHRFHPPKYSEYSRKVTTRHTKEYINTKPVVNKSELSKYVLDKYEYVPNPLCPACKGASLVERKTKLPKYRCPKCRQEFEDTVKKTVKELITLFYEEEDAVEVRDKCFVSKEWRNKNNLSNIRYWLLRERAKNKEGETIGKEAFLLYLNDSIQYLSFDDTITACRKCAYHFDIKKMELCPKCKIYYKGIQYPTCIQCLPEEQRKAALEIIELAKEWQDMHKDLGID